MLFFLCSTLHKYSPYGENTEAEEIAGILMLSHNQFMKQKQSLIPKLHRSTEGDGSSAARSSAKDVCLALQPRRWRYRFL